MDFTIPDDILALKERTEQFVRNEILPRESDPPIRPAASNTAPELPPAAVSSESWLGRGVCWPAYLLLSFSR